MFELADLKLAPCFRETRYVSFEIYLKSQVMNKNCRIYHGLYFLLYFSVFFNVSDDSSEGFIRNVLVSFSLESFWAFEAISSELE